MAKKPRALVPDPEGGLQKGDNSRHEEDGWDDVAAGGIVLLHAQRRADDERDGHGAAEHCQVVLRGITVLICLILIAMTQ